MALYIVPVPIGNLKDITARAVEILNYVDFIVVEDTRYSLKLLNSLNIKKKLVSYYKPKEEQKSVMILKLLENKEGAIITDSGTPLISDPGFILVKKVIEKGIEIISLPGPTAFVPALTNSGLPPDTFHFAGFSPRKRGKLKLYLKKLENLETTLIFYESPRRVVDFLEIANEVFGNRRFSISKELSKKNEKIIRGKLGDFKSVLGETKILGEFVIVIEGNIGESTESVPEINSMDDVYEYFKNKFGISKNILKRKLIKKSKD